MPRSNRGVLLTLLALIGRAAHLLLFIVVGNLAGATAGTDTVFLLYAPVLVLVNVIAGVAEVTVMPAMHLAQSSSCAGSVGRLLFGKALALSSIAATLVALLSLVLIPSAVPTITVLLAFIPVLAAISAFVSGLLNAGGRHASAFLGPIYGVIPAILWLATVDIGAVSLAIALLLYDLGRALGLTYQMRLIRFPARMPSDGTMAGDIVSKAIRAGKWQVVGAFFVASNPMIDLFFARQLGPGSVSLVEYANRLWMAVPVLFSGALMLIYADWSRSVAREQFRRGDVRSSAIRIGLLAFAASLVLIVLGDMIIGLIYGSGELSDSGQAKLVELFRWYLLGAGPYIAGLVYTRAFSAHGMTRALAIAAAFGAGTNLVFDATLIGPMGLSGIAVATSVSYTLTTVILMALFWRWVH